MRKSTILGLTTGIMMAMAVSASAANPAYTLDPASGSVATDLMTISIDFTDTQVFFYENNRVPAATLENKATGATYVCQEPTRDTRAMTSGMAYTMTFVEENAEDAEPITVAGEYELTIRAMYQLVDGENVDLEPITATYTINYPVDYTLNPAAGVATDLQGITLTFTDTKVSFYENNRLPAVMLENLTTGNVYTCAEPDFNARATAGSEYTFMFADLDDSVPAAINEPGEYQLTVRAMYQGEGDSMEDLPVITANYTVNYPEAYIIDPAFGSQVTDLSEINIDFTENSTVAFYENSRMPIAVLENTTTGSIYICQEATLNTRAMTSGKAYTLTFINEQDDEAAPVTEPGIYTLTIRSLYNEDGDLPVIIGNYFINYPVAYDLNPVDNAQVESISKVTLQFPETTNVMFYENGRIPVAVIQNVNTGVEYIAQEANRNTFAQLENGIEYFFVFVDEDNEEIEITEPGQYQLTIRAMYQDVDGENVDLPVITANYTIAYPVAYTLYPDNGAKAADLMQISLEFPNNFVAFYENNRIPAATLENTTTGNIYVCNEPDRDTFAQTEGSAYILTFMGMEDEDAMPITEPGQYKLTIRAMYQTVDEEMVDLPVINANYEIPYPVEYYLFPDNGANVSTIEQVTLQFPNNFVAFYENNQMAVAVLENTTTGRIYNAMEADRNTNAMLENGVEYSFTFIAEDEEDAMPITEPGQYKLTIRAMYQNVDDEMVDLPVINADYTIPYPVEYVLNPEDGASVENLKTVSIEFPYNRNVSFYENNQMAVAVLENTVTGRIYNAMDADRDTYAQTEGIIYNFTFIGEDEEEAMDITEPGQYKLTIRAMYLDNGDEDNVDLPAIIANYTIPYPVEYILTPADGDYVNEISEIGLEFPYSTNIGFYENMPIPVAVLTEIGTGAEYVCAEADRNTYAETDGVAYTLKFMNFETESYEPINVEGTYKLVIRALAMFDEEGNVVEDLPVIEATYIVGVSGVEIVKAIEKTDVYNVFDFNGMTIVRNGSADDVRNLPAGMYIINGQKVLIRR